MAEISGFARKNGIFGLKITDDFDVYLDSKLGAFHVEHHPNAPCSAYGARGEAAAEVSCDRKLTNPKDDVGSDKLPLHLWPETATAMGCIGLLDGKGKYGRANWRALGVRPSIYIDACKRHLNAWFEGEECAPDSKVPHLAHALACLAIIVDAQAAGMLNDDRQYGGGYAVLVDDLTPLVAEIQQRHAHRTPHHYTIADEGIDGND